MAIQTHLDDENIMTLTIDMKDKSMNVINNELGEAFVDVLEQIERNPDIKGVIVTSGKQGSFVAGAEIEMLYALETAQQAFDMIEAFKARLRRFEKLGKPVVACVNGTAMGGGLEIALACHHRIALNNPKAKLGLPEVKLGVLPAGGGVTRLVRMLGLQAAFPYLMEGKEMTPQAAHGVGIVNELADSPEEMIEKAKAWIRANPSPKAPWDERGFKIPGGGPTRPDIAQMLAIAPAMLRKKTYRNYPAAEAIMNAAVEGAHVDFDTASRIESRYFAHLMGGPVSKNMIGAFWIQLNKIKSGASRPDVARTETNKVGILGAGMMGHGIAFVSALAGMHVVMKDVNQDAVDAGLEKIKKLLNKRRARGKMTQEKFEETLGRITATTSAEDLQACDLIIEAVFEDRALKAKVTQEAESVIADDAVFGSNTSTLPITSLAEASQRPANFVGIHFFSPVEKMPLVEIIRGEQTSDTALAKAFDYVLAIKKTPIVVNDSRGFYTSRVFSTYVQEGQALLAEGQHPRTIEAAGMQAGMPVGPLALSDEVSLSLMKHIYDQTKKDFEAEGKTLPKHPSWPVLETMIRLDRKGKAAGAGFYEYPTDGGNKFLWPGLKEHFPLAAEQLEVEEMVDRMLYVQSIETVRCMEEGVFDSVPDGNIGSIFGWGFAPYTGGTLQFINHIGPAAFVERARELAERYGERFEPPQMLLDMAASNRSFEVA